MVGHVWFERATLALRDNAVSSRQSFCPNQEVLIEAPEYISLQLRARQSIVESGGNTVRKLSGCRKDALSLGGGRRRRGQEGRGEETGWEVGGEERNNPVGWWIGPSPPTPTHTSTYLRATQTDSTHPLRVPGLMESRVHGQMMLLAVHGHHPSAGTHLAGHVWPLTCTSGSARDSTGLLCSLRQETELPLLLPQGSTFRLQHVGCLCACAAQSQTSHQQRAVVFTGLFL